MNYTVFIGFDEAERRFFVVASDIAGLHVETESYEAFVDVARDAARDLIGGDAEIRFERL
jgi:hypothetical protein